ncbi:MAG: 3-oxoacyl-[acyl-carrier-protein] reductase [Actinobacteria bacterium RBG_16_68_21]|nr:MAG: 3-oxoacyl-[acyl-carrier-protein] reductase [Actinobacteria bacterium RBG_16_68_21]
MGRVALITGGSRGIGRAIALHLGASGHRVAVNYHTRAEAAEETVTALTAAGGTGLAVPGDVGDGDAVTEMFATVTTELGPVEILVNNAGITADDLLLRMTPEAWSSVIQTNLTSAYLCTKAALRGMVKAKWGRIISVTSVSGISGNAGQANYAAAKAGLIGFTKSVAKEVGSRGITVNAVAPGFVATEMTDALGEEARRAVLPLISLGRFGTPAEIASVVGYLASDQASYVTGQVLVVDGGLGF